MAIKPCLVFFPNMGEIGVGAESSMDAVVKALDRVGRPIPDDAIAKVIVGGKSFVCWDATEHNAKQPTYRHGVAAVKAWRQRQQAQS